MSFVSVNFMMMVLVTVIIYFLFSIKYRWMVLLAASIYYYVAVAGWQALLITTGTTAVVWLLGLCIEKNIGTGRKKRRLFLAIAVVIVFGLLILFKLSGKFDFSIDFLVVPLGVSYYSFSLIGYLVDIYYGKAKAERNPLKLYLFTLYFPKITQGPISKYRELSAGLFEGHRVDYNRICFGMQRLLWGFFKKLVIADRIAFLTGSVFDNFANYDDGGAVLVIATILAVIRHYSDFSGYMDIAIGISEILGIKLDENFKQPFFSQSAAEFWRGWHVTLGIWFKDYIYMPIVINPKLIKCSGFLRKKVGKRTGKALMSIVPLMSVWFLTGMWHGTGINYLVWGLYWGVIIAISTVFSPEISAVTKKLHINTESKVWKGFRMLRTSMIFTGGYLISTLVGLDGIRKYAGNIIKDLRITNCLNGTLWSLGMNKLDYLIVFVGFILLVVVSVLQYKGKTVRKMIADLPGILRWVIYAVLIVVVLYYGVYGLQYGPKTFAYEFF